MAAFYARYVPPSRPAQALETYDRSSSKRKYEGDHEDFEATQKRPKTETGKKGDRLTQKQSHSPSKELRSSHLNILQSRREKNSTRSQECPPSKPDSEGREVLAKYSSVKSAEKSNSIHISRRNSEGGETGALNSGSRPQEAQLAQREKKKREKKDSSQDEAITTGDEDQSTVLADGKQPNDGLSDQRHAGVRQKFETSKANARINAMGKEANNRKQEHGRLEDTNEEGAVTVELHGLESLPQPPQPEPSTELPTYSTLPGWMATPLRVAPSITAYFKDLDLDTRLISNLQEKGIIKAFAIQAAVLPLLTKGTARHRGDICISAATGSGKTLAYVLPMIQDLKDFAGTKLRGLVVVPTRELVAQAREVCEVCAAGTNVRIATALGSRALKDEQNVLVESHVVYDPGQYKTEQEQPIDWTNFGLEDILAQSDEAAPPANYVKRFASKVDVLVTTPGRLVDHLRSTPGFTLDDVQWVVIDEADRLLNESFQEWIEVVMPALNSNTAARSRDELLREMRLDIPERNLQKVILSATMTQDISKLNSLGLRNPKLVVVGDLANPRATIKNGVAADETEPITDADGIFNLPATLSEFAVSVGDGSEKPLYLLELLKSRILDSPEQRSRLHGSTIKDTASKTGFEVSNGALHEPGDTSSSDSSEISDSDPSSDGSHSNSSSSTTPRRTNHAPGSALIFTRSTEAASRLTRLLSILSPSLTLSLGTLTKSANFSSSRKVLSQFRQGKITLLIATDRASRGLDLPGLAHVVSYDVPTSATTYIHRVGRTARAGKEGKAWTLVGHREARWFWNEIGKAGGEVRIGRGERKVKRVNVDIGDDDGLRKKYEGALRVLGDEVRGNA